MQYSFIRNAGLSLAISLGGSFAAQAEAANDEHPDISLSTGIVEFSGYLNQTELAALKTKIDAIRDASPDTPIRLEFGDSRGGELESGFALSQLINEAGNIDLVCQGNMQSMTANFFISYQGGERILGENCTNLMLHDVILSIPTSSIGRANSPHTYLDGFVENTRLPYAMMTQAASEASGMNIESARALFGEDCHLSPEKAYALNLADSFENSAAELPARIHNPSPQDIYDICGTRPLESYFDFTDWSQYRFNGVGANDITP